VFFQAVWHQPMYRFLILFLGIFGLLYYFNIAYMGLVTPGNYYVPALDIHFDYIEGLRTGLLNMTSGILEAMGYRVSIMGIWLRVVGRGGFNMAYDCLGYGVMSFLIAFVVAYPKSLKSKLWFLPLGLLLIQTLNIIRFVLLGLFWKQSGLKEHIDHHDIFNIVLYIVLLMVIYFWINDNKLNKSGKEAVTIHEANSTPKSV
jgi:exosortase/archaeosortase family protein